MRSRQALFGRKTSVFWPGGRDRTGEAGKGMQGSELVLASGSETRAGMLRNVGVEVRMQPTAVDEAAVREAMGAEGHDVESMADALAELKAVRTSARLGERTVLGADQILAFEGEAIGKPETMAEARAQLLRLAGREHLLVSAAVLARNGSPTWRCLDRAALRMRRFDEGFVDGYLAAEGLASLRASGLYRVEGRGAQLFDRIRGDMFTVLGLPLLPLLGQLRELGLLPK